MATSVSSLPLTIIDQLSVRKTYVSSTEAIKILGVTRHTFCAWVREGKFPALMIGTGYKVDPVAFAVWLEARQL